MQIRRFPDLEALSWALVDYFANLVHPYDRFCVALSGGNTPKRFYELLSTREDIEWHKIHLFYGDERYVPPDDPRSNERMIREALVQCIDIPIENVHHIYDPDGWEESARRYNETLHRFFDERDYTFDLALQGMGDDGHTASIFPGVAGSAGILPACGLEARDPVAPWVITTQGPPESPERISCNLDCLAASKEVIFIVSGAEKAKRLEQVIDGDLRFPAAVLAAHAKNVHWWIDEAAASHL
ncbi:MAG: 6-phosphogluconolactonase [Fimbriimonadales bacterium]